ncbi:hypothetical protein ABE402_05890 [Bacillus smithii]|uniref:hypothetical protein n=1 Tax=Bacillus smithii TaxID=1479 RepID=UPI003D1BF3E9
MSDKERMDQLLSQLSGFTNLEDGYGCRTNLFADEMSELIGLLVKEAEKVERYEKALENILISPFPLDIDDAVAIAKQALLEESE